MNKDDLILGNLSDAFKVDRTNEDELITKLFKALDDAVKHQYYRYQRYNGEYPTELSVNTLIDATTALGIKSEALTLMWDNLPEDIQR